MKRSEKKSAGMDYFKEFSKKEYSKIDFLKFAEKEVKETIISVLSAVLQLDLPQKTAIEVISTIIFASKCYNMGQEEE